MIMCACSCAALCTWLSVCAGGTRMQRCAQYVLELRVNGVAQHLKTALHNSQLYCL